MRHYKKTSRRAYLVRIAPINRIPVCSRAGLSCANSRHVQRSKLQSIRSPRRRGRVVSADVIPEFSVKNR